jgi:hypothetical protein
MNRDPGKTLNRNKMEENPEKQGANNANTGDLEMRKHAFEGEKE